MNLTSFQTLLREHADALLRFELPDGGRIPAHAHITEVGRVDKKFLDCGGALRMTSACVLQAWVADDVDHRITCGKLVSILDRAADVLQAADLPVEIEFEDRVISQFPVTDATRTGDQLVVSLGLKHTDCLAKDVCIPRLPSLNRCAPGSGCC